MKKHGSRKYFILIMLGILLCALAFGVPLANAIIVPVQSGGGGTGAPSPASPGVIGCFTNLVTCGTYWLSYLLNVVVGLLVALGAFLVSSILALNGQVFSSPVVQNGFGVALSVANLGFVLAIIIIALATILHRETYGVKKLLWKLVVMAILVNFGLVITAPIVGFADSLTNTFIGGGTASIGQSNYFNFVDSVTTAFAPQDILTNQSTTLLTAISTSGSGTDGFVKAVLSLVFGLIFEGAMAIALLALAALLFIRYVYLSILLILLPLAWLCWIFPSFSGQFRAWWRNFIKWTFFPAAAVFFMWLAFGTVSQVAANRTYLTNAVAAPTNAANNPGAALLTATGENGSAIQDSLDEMVLIALMIGGLMAASSLTGKFGGVVVGAAQSTSSAITGYAGRKTKNVVGERIKTAGRQYNPATKETTTALQRVGSKLQGIPVLGALGMNALGSRIAAQGTESKGRKESIEKYREGNLSQLDNEGIITRATSGTAFVDPIHAAAIGQELARRNLTSDPRVASRVSQFLETSEKMGTVQGILNNRPELAAQTSAAIPRFDTMLGRMETAGEAMERAIKDATRKIKGADVLQLDDKSIGDHRNPATVPTTEQIAVALNLSNGQLGKLGADGSAEQTEAFRNTVIQIFNRTTTPGAPPLPPNQQNELNRIINYVNNSPAWQNIP